jgi:two-component system chemotaxis response regulator CheB
MYLKSKMGSHYRSSVALRGVAPPPSLHGCRYDLVAIGGSAGGIPALNALLSLLPPSFPLPILVVQHLSAKLPSHLPAVLGQRTKLRCKWAEDGEIPEGGTVYVGPADRHMLVMPDRRLHLSDGPKRGWWRPAVDRLLESAAEACGNRAIGIVLSGMMWDGARGIAALREAGALTIAQDEASAGHFEMPARAIDFGGADIVLSPARIAAALEVLADLGES